MKERNYPLSVLPERQFSFTQERIKQAGREFLSRVSTAAHEIQHGLPVVGMGGIVVKISTIPNGNILGYTHWEGNFTPVQTQVIAMGGAVNHAFGAASGYGSDLFKAKIIERHFNGMSTENAKMLAEMYARQYENAVFKRAAEILAFKGVVYGNTDFINLFRQAENELKIEKAVQEGYTILLPDAQQANRSFGTLQHGVIVSLPENQQLILVKKDNKLLEAKYCNVCRKANGHTRECVISMKQKKKIEHPENLAEAA